MENRVNYILVGVFVIGLFFAGLGVILWLGKYSEDEVFKYYKVNTKDSISGLNEKAPVKLRGVTVGEVKEITINTKNSEEVSIIIQVKHETPIKEDTYAFIEPQGITGLSFLQLGGGTNNSPELKTSEDEEKMGVIPAHPSIFTRVDKTLEVVSIKAESVLTSTAKLMEKANQIFNEKNIKNINITLENSAKLSQSLVSLAEVIDNQKIMIDSITKKTLELENEGVKMTRKLTSFIDTLNNTTTLKINNAADSIKMLSQDMRKKINSRTFDIKSVAKEIIEPTKQSILNFNSLLLQTEDLIEQLRQSPSDIFYKHSKEKLGPGEKP